MTVNDQTSEETDAAATATVAVPSSRQKPAYILAREAADAAEDEKQESKKKAAFLAASQGAEEKDGAEITGKAGLSAIPDQPSMPPVPGVNETPGDDFKPDLSGAGWITCSDGTKVRDDGTSIYAPGKKLSPGQIDMILQLSMQKGWTEIYAFEPGRNRLHQEATQMLSQMAAARQMPVQCCCEKKRAGSFSSHLSDAEQAIRQVQLNRHNAAKNPAPAPA